MHPLPRLLLSCALAAVSPVLHAACGLVVEQQPHVTVGYNPLAAAMADFDKDGKLDLATPRNATGEGVVVQKGNGDFTFQTGVVYPAGAEFPTRIITADFNNDTWPDLATVNNASNNFSVLLNNGDGTFAEGLVTPTVSGPKRITAGDTNNDGFLEVGVVGLTSAWIHFGNGNGTFSGTIPLSVEGFPEDIAFGELDGVHGPDVVVYLRPVSANPSTIRIFLRTLFGTYTASSATLPAKSAGTLAVRDLNGDGNAEIVAVNTALKSLSVFRGSTFMRADIALDDQPEAAVFGDVDEDGKDDLLVATSNSSHFAFLHGEGDGTLTYSRREYVTSPSYPLNLQGVAVGDINGDFINDIVFVDAGQNLAFPFRNHCSARHAAVGLSSTPNPSQTGQQVTLTATITVAGTVDPTGTVSFYEGATLLGTVGVASRSASLALTPSIGTHTYTARYNGDTVFGASTSPAHAHTVNAPPFGTPSNFTATGTAGGTQVALSWIGTGGVAYYEVLRRAAGSWVLLGTTVDSAYTDTTAGANASFFYAVRGVAPGGAQSGMAVDAASTAAFAYPSLEVIRAIDVTELRSITNALRASAGLGAYSFTDAMLTGTIVKAVHITDLRTALSQAMTAAGMSAPSFSRAITPGLTILANDVVEMRSKIR